MTSTIRSKISEFLDCFASVTSIQAIEPMKPKLIDQIEKLIVDGESTEHTCRRLLSIPVLRTGVPNAMARIFSCWTNSESEPVFMRGSQLKRTGGGSPFFVIGSGEDSVQVGAPSESIKNFLNDNEPVPHVYVLPPSGLLLYGDIEFPLFWNFFIEQAFKYPEKRVIVIGTAEQLRRVSVVFSESMFGPSPDNLFLKEDGGLDVDFSREALALSAKVTCVEDFATLLELDSDGRAIVASRGLEVSIIHNTLVEVKKNGEVVGVVDVTGLDAPGSMQTLASSSSSLSSGGMIEPPIEVFVPPAFGVTFIGTSHGFDGHGLTTGFIVWLDGCGVLVDPPVGTIDFLAKNRIDPVLIRNVILTHVHADHDGGLLPLLLKHPYRLTLHTFKTVYLAFLRKLHAKGLKNPQHLLDWVHVTCNNTFIILGGSFEFNFSFHALPTLCFRVEFANRVISYSADTFYEPKRLRELHESGVFSEKRLESLLTFAFKSSDLIIHECGVPPIHTPESALAAMDDDLKKKTVVVHCHQLTVPNSGLRIPGTGMNNTIVVPVGDVQEGLTMGSRILFLLNECVHFVGMSSEVMLQLLQHKELVHFRGKDVMIQVAEQDDDHVYMIIDGVAIVTNTPTSKRAIGTSLGLDDFPEWPPRYAGRENQQIKLFCSSNWGEIARDPGLMHIVNRGELVGISRILENPGLRTASIVAATDLIALRWRGSVVRGLLQKTGRLDSVSEYIQSMLLHQRFLQESLSRETEFAHVAPQLLHVLSGMVTEVKRLDPGDKLFQEGESSQGLYCVREGWCEIFGKTRNGDPFLVARKSEGQVFGELSILRTSHRTATVVAGSDGCVLLTIPRHRLAVLLDVPSFRKALEAEVDRVEARSSLTNPLNLSMDITLFSRK